MSIEDLIIVRISGRGLPVPGDNIDTDRITPADAMTEPDYSNAVLYLFRDAKIADPNHPLNNPAYKGAAIMIVGANFGSGSSRETAPQAIKRHGISALVGVSFAPIFEGNCRALGMPAVTASREDVAELMELTARVPSTKYLIDLKAKTLTYNGTTLPIDLPEYARIALITGRWDALAMLHANQDKVAEVAGRLPYMKQFAP